MAAPQWRQAHGRLGFGNPSIACIGANGYQGLDDLGSMKDAEIMELCKSIRRDEGLPAGW